jgi:UDP-N-acetylglucosamine acyltransferase
LAGHVTVGKFAVIGGLAAVHQFIHIGDHAMISGGSLVRKDSSIYKSGERAFVHVGLICRP